METAGNLNMATKRQSEQLKNQISDVILNDSSLIKSIAEAVSSLIVEKLSSDESFISKIADSVVSQPKFIEATVNSLEVQSAVKQEVYESLSFDYKNLKDSYEETKNTCKELCDKNESLIDELDGLEQYGRRNCLLLHGVPECPTGEEETDQVALKIINEKLNLQLDESDLDRSHRLRRNNHAGVDAGSNQPAKPRPIIIKFVSHNTRSEVFMSKRKLKGSGLGISESLARRRMRLYSDVSKHSNVKSTWTLDGRIIALLKGSSEKKVVIEKRKDLSKLS